MSSIKIKNFGPIGVGNVENDGWIDISRVTVFIGEQGSGKSTVAKLISTFSWIEKDLFRSDGSTLRFRKQERIFKKYLEYHRISSYLKDSTEIEYDGEAYHICYTKGNNLEITSKQPSYYQLPKITYYPAERSFISSIKSVRSEVNLRMHSASLQEFKEVFQEAKESLREREYVPLPVCDTQIEYNRLNDVLYVRGNDYKVVLSDAASGFQSLTPLFLVARYVEQTLDSGREMNDQQREDFNKRLSFLKSSSLTDEQFQLAVSKLSAQFNNRRIFNIVEEPEQNLFPKSQQSVLNMLLECNNAHEGNCLVVTTHSPYLISHLMLAIQACEANAHAAGNKEVQSKIFDLVPQKSLVAANDVDIYELENNGLIHKLEKHNDLPTDDNYLNNELGKANELFSKLLELEDQCL